MMQTVTCGGPVRPSTYSFCRQCGDIYMLDDDKPRVFCAPCYSKKRAKARSDNWAAEHARSLYYPLKGLSERAKHNGPADHQSVLQEKAYREWEDRDCQP